MENYDKKLESINTETSIELPNNTVLLDNLRACSIDEYIQIHFFPKLIEYTSRCGNVRSFATAFVRAMNDYPYDRESDDTSTPTISKIYKAVPDIVEQMLIDLNGRVITEFVTAEIKQICLNRCHHDDLFPNKLDP